MALAGARVNRMSEAVERNGTVWTGGFMRFGDRYEQSGPFSQEFNSEGISLGVDYQFSPSFAVGIGRDQTDVGGNGSRNEATAQTMAVYVSQTLGKGIFLEWLGGCQWLEFDLRRYVTSIGSLVNSSRSGHQCFATGSLGAEIAIWQWLFTPYLRLDLVRGRLAWFSETSGSLWDLRFLDQNIDFTSIGSATIISCAHRFKCGSLLPRLRAEYVHDLELNADTGMTFRDLLTGPVPTVRLTGPARERSMLGLSEELQPGNATFDLDYLDRKASGSMSDQPCRWA